MTQENRVHPARAFTFVLTIGGEKVTYRASLVEEPRESGRLEAVYSVQPDGQEEPFDIIRLPVPPPLEDTRTPEWVHRQAARLHDEGHNVEDVAHLITTHGHPVSSRTVRRHLKDECGCEEAKPKSPPTAPLPVAPSRPDGQAGQP